MCARRRRRQGRQRWRRHRRERSTREAAVAGVVAGVRAAVRAALPHFRRLLRTYARPAARGGGGELPGRCGVFSSSVARVRTAQCFSAHRSAVPFAGSCWWAATAAAVTSAFGGQQQTSKPRQRSESRTSRVAEGPCRGGSSPGWRQSQKNQQQTTAKFIKPLVKHDRQNQQQKIIKPVKKHTRQNEQPTTTKVIKHGVKFDRGGQPRPTMKWGVIATWRHRNVFKQSYVYASFYEIIIIFYFVASV